MTSFTALEPVRRQLRSNRLVVFCSALLGLCAIVALAGPWLLPYDYAATDFDNRLAPPGLAGGHLFGTDELGRDLLARTLLGIQATPMVPRPGSSAARWTPS